MRLWYTARTKNKRASRASRSKVGGKSPSKSHKMRKLRTQIWRNLAHFACAAAQRLPHAKCDELRIVGNVAKGHSKFAVASTNGRYNCDFREKKQTSTRLPRRRATNRGWEFTRENGAAGAASFERGGGHLYRGFL